MNETSQPSTSDLLDPYFAELRRHPLLSPGQVVELAERMRAHEATFRAAVVRVPGTAQRVLDRWNERRAEGRVTGLLAHDARGDLETDWSAFIDERLGALAQLVTRREQVAAGEDRDALDAEIAATLTSAALLFEVLESVALELQALASLPRSRAGHARRAALGLDDRRAKRELSRAYEALAARNEARSTLAASNLRLVVRVAQNYRNQGVSLLDLIQEGNVGLLRAVEKFDPSLGYRFSTYAVWWVEQAMIRAIQRDSRTVRVPSHVYESRLKLRTASRSLAALMPDPRSEDLAHSLGIPAAAVEQTEAAFFAPESLETPRRDPESLPLSERLADEAVEDPDRNIDRRHIGEVLGCALFALDERERQVIESRFGLRDGEERTLQEIADEIGLSRERVRQIQLGGLARLASRSEVAALWQANGADFGTEAR